MCGICAFFDPELKDKDCAIQGMMDTIKHRGPSSDGKYTNDHVALGFRRLSIIDLRGGSQPIFNEDKSRAIILMLVTPSLLKLILKFYFTAMKNGEWTAY